MERRGDMKAKDLINIALLAGVGYVLYKHFGTGTSWGQSLPFGLGPMMGIQGLGCVGCPSAGVGCSSCGLGVIAPTPYLSGRSRATNGVPTLAERLIVQ